MALIDNLISYWKMDEANGTIVDSHAANDSTSEPGITYGETGIIGDAIGFVDNDAVNFGDDSDLKPHAVSWQFWVYPHDDAFSPIILSMRANSTAYGGTHIFIREDARPVWLVAEDASNWKLELTANNAANGKVTHNAWNHIVCVYTSGDARLYVNGVEQTATSAATGNIYYPAINIIFGLENDTLRDYNGHMDEVAVWSRALTEAEVIELYNSGAGFAYPFSVVGTNMNINISNDFKDVDSMQINIGNVWKDVSKVQINIANAWKTIFG